MRLSCRGIQIGGSDFDSVDLCEVVIAAVRLLYEAVALAMPLQVALFRPILWITGQKNSSPCEIRELLPRRTVFNEFLPVHEYTIIIVQRPEAAVELPVGVLRQGHAVTRIIVPGVMELVNMGRIHDAFHFTVIIR